MKILLSLVINGLLIISVCVGDQNVLNDSNEWHTTTTTTITTTSLFKQQFRNLLRSKRREQLSAVNALMAKHDYEQQYSLIETVFKKLFEVQQNAKLVIDSSDYTAGEDLPSNHSLMESISIIIENCALFGDIVLKLPDISERIIKAYRKWTPMYEWCVSFSLSTHLLDDMTAKMFDLAAQELNLVPRQPNYFNPYRKKSEVVEHTSNDKPSKKTEPKKRIKLKRGPQLSRASEL